MKATYEFTVSPQAHFTGDKVTVTFAELAVAGRTYQGTLIYHFRGKHLAEITSQAGWYTGDIRETRRDAVILPEKKRKEIEAALYQAIKKEIGLALQSAKLARVQAELALAQRRVEKLLIIRDNLQKITGK